MHNFTYFRQIYKECWKSGHNYIVYLWIYLNIIGIYQNRDAKHILFWSANVWINTEIKSLIMKSIPIMLLSVVFYWSWTVILPIVVNVVIKTDISRWVTPGICDILKHLNTLNGVMIKVGNPCTGNSVCVNAVLKLTL